MITNIRRQFDLDADIEKIEADLGQSGLLGADSIQGLRLPGVWSPMEAGVRAIVGQQISVSAAIKQVTRLVQELGAPLSAFGSFENSRISDFVCFPEPQKIVDDPLEMLGMPGARKQCIRDFARLFAEQPEPTDTQILAVKGVGQWTLDYLRMRGRSQTDVWLGGDLVIRKAVAQLESNPDCVNFDPEQLKPWRSYACLHLWSSVS